MTDQLKYFWKNWNELVMFIISIALFFAWPLLYRVVDATAGAFDAGMLHVIPSGFMITQFILAASWMTYKFTFPKLHKWMDDSMETNTIEVTNKFEVNVFSVKLYFAYVAVHAIIFVALI